MNEHKNLCSDICKSDVLCQIIRPTDSSHSLAIQILDTDKVHLHHPHPVHLLLPQGDLVVWVHLECVTRSLLGRVRAGDLNVSVSLYRTVRRAVCEQYT